MSNYEDWLQDQPAPKKEQPALVVAPIHGVLPYAGALNPLTRSDTAKRVSVAIATLMTGGIRQVYHFDGEFEYAVALSSGDRISGPLWASRRIAAWGRRPACPQGGWYSCS